MENQNKVLEEEHIINNMVENQKLISLGRFIVLVILTCGLYELWWMYKSWRFFQQKEQLDILPAVRALLSIIFLIPLLYRIKKFAQLKGYAKSYSSVLLFIGFFILQFLVFLPDPYWLISLLSLIFLIPAFNALNYAKRNSTDFIVEEQTSFNARQVVLIVIGSIYWILLVLGLFVLALNGH